MNSRYFAILVLAIGMLAVPVASTAQDQSAASAAKEKPAKAKHVYTDDDLPSTRAGSAASSSSTSVANETTDDKKDDKKEPEKPATSQELQKQLDSVKHDKALLEKRLTQLQGKADQAVDPFRKRMYEDSVINQQTTLAEFDKQQKDLEARLAEQQKKEKMKLKKD